MYRYLILIFSLFLAVPSLGQEKRDSIPKLITHFGIRIGCHISVISSARGGSHPGYIELRMDDPSKTGFSIGISPEFRRKGHLSIQTEISYYHVNHKAEIFELNRKAHWPPSPGTGHTQSITPVNLSTTFRLAPLCKFSIGRSQIVNIMLGPDIRIPASPALKTTFGISGVLRLDFPLNKGDFLCFEIRQGADLTDMLDQNYLMCREMFAGVSIAYLIHKSSIGGRKY